MDILIILLALSFLMFAAYRGFSVVLFAPLAAVLAVLLVDPRLVPPFFSGIFMERMVAFVKLYFPVFLLGAIFGKAVEVSGFARSIIRAILGAVGPRRAILAVVIVCALLTYGGVSLFVVAFAVYPFGAEMFRLAGIPKRLLPATIALGAFTFTMDALPGSPQIQNIIPTTFFGTDAWAAPWLGLVGAAFVFAVGMTYLEWRSRQARRQGEGYGVGHINEPEPHADERLPHPALALAPLAAVGVLNKLFTVAIPQAYGETFDFARAGVEQTTPLEVDKLAAIWAVEGALLAAILIVAAASFRRLRSSFGAWTAAATGGAMLAALNTGSEYGFGAVIAALPGFRAVSGFLAEAIHDPLLNVAVTTNALAGITGSASGGMSIALAAMGETYLNNAVAAGIPPEVLHRVAAMASGGMDTLPHNGAVITLLMVTGLSHRHSYREIFVMTLIKTSAVFLVIGVYYLFNVH
ncbi:MAG: GntP family permease [Bryobacteraceae bacterium]|nr:GntP family permease [Bryobacteraceae bacterium]